MRLLFLIACKNVSLQKKNWLKKRGRVSFSVYSHVEVPWVNSLSLVSSDRQHLDTLASPIPNARLRIISTYHSLARK